MKNNLNFQLIENPNKEPKECKTIRGRMEICVVIWKESF